MRNLSILGKSDQAQSVAQGETTQVIIMASSLLSALQVALLTRWQERRDPGGSGDSGRKTGAKREASLPPLLFSPRHARHPTCSPARVLT